MSKWLLFLLPCWAMAINVSLLQQSQDIVCEIRSGNEAIKEVWIDKKDYRLSITNKDNKVEEFEQERFFDQGILAKSQTDPSRLMFVQTLPNGTVYLHIGERLSFRESSCEDTGASKLCKSEVIGTLKWTPEKLSLKNAKHNISVDVLQYGFFPNRSTYVWGQESKKRALGYPSLLMLDFGAPVDLLIGFSSELICRYK